MKPIKVFILDGVANERGNLFSSSAFVEYPESVYLIKDFSTAVSDVLGKARLKQLEAKLAEYERKTNG